jgi:hypothetical protein
MTLTVWHIGNISIFTNAVVFVESLTRVRCERFVYRMLILFTLVVVDHFVADIISEAKSRSQLFFFDLTVHSLILDRCEKANFRLVLIEIRFLLSSQGEGSRIKSRVKVEISRRSIVRTTIAMT